jgi:hypothetical protein
VHRKINPAQQPGGPLRRSRDPCEALVQLGDVKPEQGGNARQKLGMCRRTVLDLLDCRLRDADLLGQKVLRPAFGFARLSNLFKGFHDPACRKKVIGLSI